MKKILIVNSNYYKKISDNLVSSSKKKIRNYKFKLYIIDVPGIFEIPYVIAKYIKKYDGFIALGCVIKGQTPHFDLITKSVFDSLAHISVNHKKPIGNGIITSLNMSQAIKRSSANVKSLKPNKGYEAAKAVISTLQNEPKSF